MNQTILVPTDFSNNSLIAARYGIELARKMRGHVHIFHAYRPFTSAFQSPLANQTDEERAKIGAEKGLAEFMDKLGRYPDLQVTAGTAKNSLLEAINNYIKEDAVSLVVMGAHGASGTRKDLLGNNTYDVAKDVSRPLLIVPEHTNSFKLENVVFFTDYQQGDIKGLTSFNTLFGDIAPSCTLVHIHEGKDAPTDDDLRNLEQWKVTLEKETPVTGLSTEMAHVPENVEEVNEILDRLKADMTLITLIDSRGFFKKLLHKSLARAIVLNPHTPVLLTSEDTE
ncbi:universal stress protein [Sphingobacterium wenxiniae]|uniref:Nucleotide-binding universal stress protein, UspA family n=1 Tax=Sphingobacterium wenxiniae TaxID=683125 RepID=A0A1I6SGC1_9SPHI|nr:universal stress protein [Sphingobacterium wenxiniae]SFS76026.1 Nucleotide-binding universal stress protein, UspA family [Sphingobacterium wenxiniae]